MSYTPETVEALQARILELEAEVVQWEIFAGWLLEQHHGATCQLPWRVRGVLYVNDQGVTKLSSEPPVWHNDYGRNLSITTTLNR